MLILDQQQQQEARDGAPPEPEPELRDFVRAFDGDTRGAEPTDAFVAGSLLTHLFDCAETPSPLWVHQLWMRWDDLSGPLFNAAMRVAQAFLHAGAESLEQLELACIERPRHVVNLIKHVVGPVDLTDVGAFLSGEIKGSDLLARTSMSVWSPSEGVRAVNEASLRNFASVLSSLLEQEGGSLTGRLSRSVAHIRGALVSADSDTRRRIYSLVKQQPDDATQLLLAVQGALRPADLLEYLTDDTDLDTLQAASAFADPEPVSKMRKNQLLALMYALSVRRAPSSSRIRTAKGRPGPKANGYSLWRASKTWSSELCSGKGRSTTRVGRARKHRPTRTDITSYPAFEFTVHPRLSDDISGLADLGKGALRARKKSTTDLRPLSPSPRSDNDSSRIAAARRTPSTMKDMEPTEDARIPDEVMARQPADTCDSASAEGAPMCNESPRADCRKYAEMSANKEGSSHQAPGPELAACMDTFPPETELATRMAALPDDPKELLELLRNTPREGTDADDCFEVAVTQHFDTDIDNLNANVDGCSAALGSGESSTTSTDSSALKEAGGEGKADA